MILARDRESTPLPRIPWHITSARMAQEPSVYGFRYRCDCIEPMMYLIVHEALHLLTRHTLIFMTSTVKVLAQPLGCIAGLVCLISHSKLTVPCVLICGFCLTEKLLLSLLNSLDCLILLALYTKESSELQLH